MRDEIDRIRATDIKTAIRDAASDPLFLADVEETTAAFRWTDGEGQVAKNYSGSRHFSEVK